MLKHRLCSGEKCSGWSMSADPGPTVELWARTITEDSTHTAHRKPSITTTKFSHIIKKLLSPSNYTQFLWLIKSRFLDIIRSLCCAISFNFSNVDAVWISSTCESKNTAVDFLHLLFLLSLGFLRV